MFSVRQKREISEAVQKILRETDHPELPKGEIKFNLHVLGAESWSWADIRNNGAVNSPSINRWNESQDPKTSEPEEVSYKCLLCNCGFKDKIAPQCPSCNAFLVIKSEEELEERQDG